MGRRKRGGEVTREREREAGNILLSGFVQVLMDFMGRPWVEGGRVRTGGRDRGSEGRSGTGRQEEGIFGERRGWRDAGSLKGASILVNTFVHVQSDFMDRPCEGDGGVRKGGRDRGRKGRIGTARKEEGAFGGRSRDGGTRDAS